MSRESLMLFGEVGGEGISIRPLWLVRERGDSNPHKGIEIRGYRRTYRDMGNGVHPSVKCTDEEYRTGIECANNREANKMLEYNIETITRLRPPLYIQSKQAGGDKCGYCVTIAGQKWNTSPQLIWPPSFTELFVIRGTTTGEDMPRHEKWTIA